MHQRHFLSINSNLICWFIKKCTPTDDDEQMSMAATLTEPYKQSMCDHAVEKNSVLTS